MIARSASYPSRVLHVIATLDAGGTEMAALRLIDHWNGESVEQEALVISRSSAVIEPQLTALVPYQTIGEGAVGLGTIFRAVRLAAKRFRPDAVLIHTFGLHHVAAAAAARSTGVHRVAGSAGNPPPEDARSRSRWANVLRLSHLIGCPVAGCSDAVHTQLIALGAGMPKGSFAIPYGVTFAPTSPRPVRPISVIGMVARLDEIKDHDTLLRAFAIVRQTAPATRLLIIGDGPLRAALEALSQSLGIGEHVDFLGRRTDVEALLEKLDLFVFATTRDEGFGIVLIEAMAKRVPIVASDVPACREVLDGGTVGLLVAAGDPQATAEGILKLVRHPDQATALAERAHDRVVAQYSIAAAAAKWRKILRLA